MAKKRPKPKAEKRRKPKPKPKPKPIRVVREHELRPMIREAARAGLVEAIEHCSNFWNVSDGYKRFIEQQIELRAKAFIDAARLALREELKTSLFSRKLDDLP